ncbi:MAG: adenine deaminase [Chloroflexota bacterium]|nr:adenine deaminase [Chloroflexota bacterium]
MNPSSYFNISRDLVDVAMGRKKADLVIRGGRWVCVQSGEIIPDTDIAITGERIAYVGKDASHTIGENTQVIDANDRFLVPGLIDAHMHIESGMLTVTEFTRAVIPHGTTGMFIDPHEIANVFGIEGVRLMAEEATQQPIHLWVEMPSCVPSAPGFETPGAIIGPEEIAEAMSWDNIVGLGEMMNFPAVSSGDEKIHQELAETRAAGKVIGGHYAAADLGLPFHGYVAAGVEDDHEGTRLEDAVARARQGMKVMLRYGSAWHDVAQGVRAIIESGIDPRHFILCTDDSHSQTLVYDGHVNQAVNQAIANGVSPITAIQMATLNSAEHFGVSREVGMIAPGRYADILLVKDINHIVPDLVIGKGVILAKNGEVYYDVPKNTYPEWVFQSVKFHRAITSEDFVLSAPTNPQSTDQKAATANIIGVIENQAPTRHLRLKVPVRNGEVHSDITNDILKLALINRHNGTGKIQVGLVQGFGFKHACAVASTVVHDSHQLIVAGTDERDMALAANELARVGGGQVVIKDQEIIGLVELPIAGIMSNERAEIVAQKVETLLRGFRACGCNLNNPNMQLSLLGLVVIPEIRISDLGLLDVNNFEFIPVLESESD